MQPDSYDAMTKALAKISLIGQMQREDQLIVSSQQGPVWPNRGNSFWLSRKDGHWYLSTWLPVGYKIPADQDIVALCSTCMMIAPSAMYRVPAEVITKFGLQEIDEGEYERLFANQ